MCNEDGDKDVRFYLRAEKEIFGRARFSRETRPAATFASRDDSDTAKVRRTRYREEQPQTRKLKYRFSIYREGRALDPSAPADTVILGREKISRSRAEFIAGPIIKKKKNAAAVRHLSPRD